MDAGPCEGSFLRLALDSVVNCHPRESPQMQTAPGNALAARFGPYRVDFRAGELHKHGIRIRLQDQPLQILALLLKFPGEVVTREELRQKLWPEDTFVDFDHGLNNAINRLREALNDSADEPRYIETLPRRGYRFIAALEADIPPGPAEPAAPSAASGSITAGLPAPVQPAVWRRYPALNWTVGVGGALLLVAGATNLAGLRDRLLGPANPPIRRIAVLPLENLTGDPQQEYFVDGMTDALISDLAQLGTLEVISRTSVMGYKIQPARKLLPEIARELKVDAVVEGTVKRSGDRVQISAQLIHASTDRHLLARSYERDLRDILSLQRELARAIATEIQLQITPQGQAHLARTRPVNPEAYEASLLGRYFWNKFNPEGYARSIEYFEKAIEKDPSYATAYVGLSDALRMRAFEGGVIPADAMRQAEAAARRALLLDDTLAEAHSALAGVKARYYWDWAGSEAGYRRAVELNPSYAEGHREFAVFLRFMGRYDEAIAELQHARDLDPHALVHKSTLAGTLLAAGRHDEALQLLQKVLAIDPSFELARLHLGRLHRIRGDLRRAIDEFEALAKQNPRYLAWLAHTQALAGNKSEARKILVKIIANSRKDFVSPYRMALVHVGLGETQQALARLEAAYQARAFEMPTVYKWEEFEPLRGEPQFQDLLRRMGLPPGSPAVPRKNRALQ